LILAVVFWIAGLLLFASERIVARLGEGKLRIMPRVLGVILATLAVQFVLNRIGGFYESLADRVA
jgi:small neutral amino acid transporter SnatA (MarC family)